MDNKFAKIRIGFGNGEIEIEGSENFVKEQITEFKDLIFSRLKHGSTQEFYTKNIQDITNTSVDELPSTTEPDKDLLNIFSFKEGKLSILLHQAPGASKKQQMINIAYLYLYGNLINGIEQVNTNDIREVCTKFSCLDSSNFMTAMKKEKTGFLISDNKGKGSNITLTQPGKKIAKELVDNLLEQ